MRGWSRSDTVTKCAIYPPVAAAASRSICSVSTASRESSFKKSSNVCHIVEIKGVETDTLAKFDQARILAQEAIVEKVRGRWRVGNREKVEGMSIVEGTMIRAVHVRATQEKPALCISVPNRLKRRGVILLIVRSKRTCWLHLQSP